MNLTTTTAAAPVSAEAGSGRSTRSSASQYRSNSLRWSAVTAGGGATEDSAAGAGAGRGQANQPAEPNEPATKAASSPIPTGWRTRTRRSPTAAAGSRRAGVASSPPDRMKMPAAAT